jgi:hypothetical protein
MKMSRSLLISFLLGMMTIIIVPVEYLHSFYDHTDTKDKTENNQTTGVEKAHLHCQILKAEFREFLLPAQHPLNRTVVIPGFLFICYQNPFISFYYFHQEQRGPPVFHS